MLYENSKRFLQLLGLLALQVLLMNHIHFLGYGSPLVYVALLLYFPLGSNKIITLVWAFTMGLMVDMFSNTPGLSSASLTFTAMCQPIWLKTLTPKDALEDMTPNYRTMGKWNHLRYLTLLLALHHVAYFLLESFSFYNISDLSASIFSSYVLSWLVIVVLETLRGRE